MSDTATINPGALTDAEYEAEIDRMIDEMKRMAVEMAKKETQMTAQSAEWEQHSASLQAAIKRMTSSVAT